MTRDNTLVSPNVSACLKPGSTRSTPWSAFQTRRSGDAQLVKVATLAPLPSSLPRFPRFPRFIDLQQVNKFRSRDGIAGIGRARCPQRAARDIDGHSIYGTALMGHSSPPFVSFLPHVPMSPVANISVPLCLCGLFPLSPLPLAFFVSFFARVPTSPVAIISPCLCVSVSLWFVPLSPLHSLPLFRKSLISHFSHQAL